MMVGTELLAGQGLGNQLFCYVTARCIAKDRGEDFAILGGETLANNMHSSCGLYFMDMDLGKKAGRADFSQVYWEKADRLYLGNSRHDLTHGAYVAGADPAMYGLGGGNTLLMGNMQAEEYFFKHREEIADWLRVKPEYDCYDFCQDDLCILHLRCTDYVGCPELFLRKSYWKQGMKQMRKLNPRMRFMVITNEVKEAEKLLPGVPAFNFDLAKDYSIIKNARYLLLSNSSFACFPAFTSQTVRYILAPKYWARHNVSNGYWASEQNIYTGFHYMDRKGRVFTAEECRRELEEYKRASAVYKRLNQRPEGPMLALMKLQCGFRRQRQRLIQFFRAASRRLRLFCTGGG